MIAKTNRFTRRQFEAARKRMKSFRSGPFLFLYRTESSLPGRFAVVVKKKTDKRAVVRNHFKRHTYERIRTSILPRAQHLQLICMHQGAQFDTDQIAPALEAFKKHYQPLSQL